MSSSLALMAFSHCQRCVTVKWEWFAMCFGGMQAAALHGDCTVKKPRLSSITNNMLCFSVFCFCDC